MEQPFVITHLYTALQEIKKIDMIINRTTFKHVTFLRKYKEKQCFCGHKILTDGVFVVQLCSMPESQFDELCGLRKIVVS